MTDTLPRADTLVQLRDRALQALGRHDYPYADRTLADVIGQSPNDVAAVVGRSRALRELNDIPQARDVLQMARDRGLDDSRLSAEEGWLAYFEGKDDDALALFQTARRNDQNNVDAIVGCSAVYRRRGNRTEAVHVLEEARVRGLREEPLDVEEGFLALDRCQYTRAQESFYRALSVHPSDEYPLAGLLTALRAVHKLDAAEQELQQRLDTFPGRPRLLTEAGWIAYDRGQYQDALGKFEDALGHYRFYEYALVGKSEVLRAEGKLRSAKDFIAKQRGLDDSPPLLTEAGWIAYDYGDTVSALEYFNRALSFPGSEANSPALIGKSQTLRVLRRCDEAEGIIEKGCRDSPDNAALWAELGIIRYAAGRPRAALECLRRANECQAWKPSLLMALGRVLWELGEDAKAKDAVKEAVDVYGLSLSNSTKPHPCCVVGKSEALRALDRPDEAVTLLRAGLAGACAGNIELYLQLSAALEDLGAALEDVDIEPRAIKPYEDALEALGFAKHLRPDNPTVLISIGRIHLRMRDEPRALAEFKAALSIDRQDAVRSALAIVDTLKPLSRAPKIREEVIREALHSSLECPPSLRARLRLELGISLYRQGQYVSAQDSFLESSRVAPTEYGRTKAHRAVVFRAEALRSLGSAEEALRIVDGVLRDVDTPQLQIERGLILGDIAACTWPQEKHKEALDRAKWTCNEVCRTARRTAQERQEPFDKIYEDARGALARILLGHGEYEEAARSLRALITDLPRSPRRAMYEVQLAWCILGDDGEDYERQVEAERWCDEAKRLNEHYAPIYGCRARIAQLRGETHAAEGFLRRAVMLEPFTPHRVDLAAILIDRACYDEARQILIGVDSSDSGDSRPPFQLGRLSLAVGQPDEARRQFQRALSRNPGNRAAIEYLAKVLCKLDRSADAERVLREGIARLQGCKQRETWRLHHALARVLVERGAEAQNADDLLAASKEVQSALREHEKDPELYYCQGQIRALLSEATHDPRKRGFFRKQALQDFDTCDKECEKRTGAKHPMARVQADQVKARRTQAEALTSRGNQILVLTLLLLLSLWVGFFVDGTVPAHVLLTLTPILLGFLIVALLLPELNRLSLPGLALEADVQKASDIDNRWAGYKVDFGQIAAELSPAPSCAATDLREGPLVRPLMRSDIWRAIGGRVTGGMAYP